MTCPNCGSENADGVAFCAQCGMYLGAKASTVKPAEEHPVAERLEQQPVQERAGHQPVASEPFVTEVVDEGDAGPPESFAPESEATSSEAPIAEPQPLPPTAPSILETAAARVREGQRLAQEQNRPDLARHLAATHDALAKKQFSIAIIGEFKQGKSSLVNALLQKAVCPVDADVVTAVPTLVTYAESPYAKAHFEPSDDEDAETVRPIAISEVEEFVADRRMGLEHPLRMVEVGLPHRLLRSGMCLVDTPGVGGLESAQGVLTMNTLSSVQGALFVTDASQELTEPEVDFLKQAAQRCPSITVVVTKTDLYQEWRRIVEIDAGHLRRAGIDVRVIAVSSFLRLRASRDPELTEESGFRPLIQHLAEVVMNAATVTAAAAATSEVRFVAGELARQVDAERTVIEEPQQAEAVVAKLATTEARTAQLVSPGASWQQALTDGIQDLISDVEHDLQRSLRLVIRDTEAIVDQSDPQSTWADTELWLRRQVALVAVANRDLLSSRTAELVDAVARHFDLDASEIAFARSTPIGALEQLSLPSATTLKSPTGRLASSLMAARFSVLVPSTMVGAGGLLGATLLVTGPIGLALGAGLGYKLIKGESRRQIAYRRQQGKAAVRRFLDEVAFVLNKDCRDTLRVTQRTLRDEFQQRAQALHHSSRAALESARAVQDLDEDRRVSRAAELAEQSRRVSQLAAPLVAGAGRGV